MHGAGGRRRILPRDGRELCIKTLLFVVPLIWFVFAVKMTYLSTNVDDESQAQSELSAVDPANDRDNNQQLGNQGDERLLSEEDDKKEAEANEASNSRNGHSVFRRMWDEMKSPDRVLSEHGEEGRAVVMDVDSLNHEQRGRYEEGLRLHHFNEYASDLISLHRAVPDFRHQRCLQQDCYKSGDIGLYLQAATVIICFYNEAWSTLLRTVHSVLDRTPPHLLQEIVLVDDCSQLDYLKDDLDSYLAEFPNVKLVRMPERVGLVRARLAGIEVSQGPIIIFLDSHVECADGWIEPLVYEVSRNRTVAVTPIIDVIDDKTMEILKATLNVGIVNVKTMTFGWNSLPPRIQNLRKSGADPFISPTMAGGLFAINKEFFMQLGTWDPGLVLWGGENLELSFKLWMCGGAVLIHPCSRVSHVFREHSPYLKDNADRVVNGNAARVAEVWLDEYKDFFFKGNPYNASLYGDVSERIHLRKTLQCRGFDWYVDNIYPELFKDGVGKRTGHIRSSDGLCLGQRDEWSQTLSLSEHCDTVVVWQTTDAKEIRHENTCLQYTQESEEVLAGSCDSKGLSQAFRVTALLDVDHIEGAVRITHIPSDLCLTIAEPGGKDAVLMAPCHSTNIRQVWSFKINPTGLS